MAAGWLVVFWLATSDALQKSCSVRGGSLGPRLHPRSAVKEIATFEQSDFGETWPYKDADFSRVDDSIDSNFYSQPRIVKHIDDGAISSLTSYYRQILTPGADVLDICSSCISHLPSPEEVQLGRVSAVGMNADELSLNKALSDYQAKDLNLDPSLPFEDGSFDFVFNVVSVDYLTQPLAIFKEMNRVLRPGGTAAMSFSLTC